MAIRINRQQTYDGRRYTITGLTFDQLFRIKHAMLAEAEKMRAISQGEAKDDPHMKARFEEFAADARAVAVAVRDCI